MATPTHAYYRAVFPDSVYEKWPNGLVWAHASGELRPLAAAEMAAVATDLDGWINPDLVTVHDPQRPIDTDDPEEVYQDCRVVLFTAPISLGPPSPW